MESRTLRAVRWAVNKLPTSWLERMDAWVSKPPPPPPPRCEWRSVWDRQCEGKKGHGGTCMTEGPENKVRIWYGINYDIVEGIPVPKRQAMARTGSMRLGH